MHTHKGEARIGLSLSPEQGHEGRVRKVPQEDRCSSMYSNYMQLCVVIVLQIMHSCNMPLSCIRETGL
jgi:hypothetical protein